MNDTTQTITDQVLLTMDYSQSLEAMIAAGDYDWTNPDITVERFPIKGTGAVPVEARLFHLGRFISSKAAVDAIKADDTENPWQPAKIEHLLAFGVSNPDEQRNHPIVALGSVAEVGERYVPYLDGGRAKLCLNLLWWDGDWPDYYRFLAVRALPTDA